MDTVVFTVGLCVLLLIPSFCVCGNVDFSNVNQPLRYSTAELRSMKPRLKSGLDNVLLNLNLPNEMKRRKRGKAGGVRKRLKSRKFKPYLPSIIMGNVQSLNNKMDELHGYARYMHEFKHISLMSFTETWLNETITDDCVNINGFKLIRGDRNLNLAEKQKGGGICLYVNEQWCHPNNVTLKHYSCSPNVEILAVGLRPFYLPREFSHVIHLTVYVPNRNVAKLAAKEICAVIQDLETAHPNAFIVIDGDFNHCTLRKNNLNYYQHVQCPTRREATLDLCYSNLKDAYMASPITKLGKSDHDMLLLLPKYRPIVQRQKPELITVKQWSPGATCIEDLQATLEFTDWNVFLEATHGIDELTQTVADYVNFCVDCTVPNKQIRIYPNNKPWITREVNSIINKEKENIWTR